MPNRHAARWLLEIVIVVGLALQTHAGEDQFHDSSIGKKPFTVALYQPIVSPSLSQANKLAPLVDGSVFYVHSGHQRSRHYVPSGWMGDSSDLSLSNSPTENPSHSPSCLKISYSGEGSQGFGWAGMYWQNPSNNWGNLPGGYNLLGMRRLTFWARGEKGGESIGVFKIGGIEGTYVDSDTAQIGPVVLTSTWKQYTIDLGNVDLSRVMGGFAWSTGRRDNPGPITFYLDQIRYER